MHKFDSVWKPHMTVRDIRVCIEKGESFSPTSWIRGMLFCSKRIYHANCGDHTEVEYFYWNHDVVTKSHVSNPNYNQVAKKDRDQDIS